MNVYDPSRFIRLVWTTADSPPSIEKYFTDELRLNFSLASPTDWIGPRTTPSGCLTGVRGAATSLAPTLAKAGGGAKIGRRTEI